MNQTIYPCHRGPRVHNIVPGGRSKTSGSKPLKKFPKEAKDNWKCRDSNPVLRLGRPEWYPYTTLSCCWYFVTPLQTQVSQTVFGSSHDGRDFRPQLWDAYPPSVLCAIKAIAPVLVHTRRVVTDVWWAQWFPPALATRPNTRSRLWFYFSSFLFYILLVPRTQSFQSNLEQELTANPWLVSGCQELLDWLRGYLSEPADLVSGRF